MNTEHQRVTAALTSQLGERNARLLELQQQLGDVVCQQQAQVTERQQLESDMQRSLSEARQERAELLQQQQLLHVELSDAQTQAAKSASEAQLECHRLATASQVCRKVHL